MTMVECLCTNSVDGRVPVYCVRTYSRVSKSFVRALNAINYKDTKPL